MNIQVQIQVCRACLKPPESVKLTEYNLEDILYKNFCELLQTASVNLPKTFCDKCAAKIKLFAAFRETAKQSEDYLVSFLTKINAEFTKSLPSGSQNIANENEDDSETEQLLQETEKEEPKKPTPATSKIEIKTQGKHVIKPSTIKTEKILKIEKIESKDTKGLIQLCEEEERLEDEGNIFGEEIYDIMEIDNEEGEEAMYLDESSNNKQVLSGDDNEFILVNFKSSSEDLTDKDAQYIVEEIYDDEKSDTKSPTRKKASARIAKDIVEKYAQTTTGNQHICTKCVKVFSTRTNLIRHIQSHDGFKPYVCEICQKGFTQSGSLKQHMYIHSGERPYKCKHCDRAFTQGKTLKFHLRRHTEEKPFTCGECMATFRQRDGLKRHLKSKHNIELVYERPNQLQFSDESLTQIISKSDGSTAEK